MLKEVVMGKTTRKTHKEFIEELKIKNLKMYRELEFFGEYKNNRTEILAKDKYGFVNVNPSRLLIGRSTTIELAIDKHNYFLEKLKIKNKKAYDTLEFLEKYKKANIKIMANDRYGTVIFTPVNILSGRVPSIRSAIDKNLYFANMAKEKHGNRYGYGMVNYINDRKEVKIICSVHGVFKQTPLSHLVGSNCPKCSGTYKITRNEFIDAANIIHNKKYDYSKVIYSTKNISVEIICPIHGSFWQKPSKHIDRKQGCPKCAGFFEKQYYKNDIAVYNLFVSNLTLVGIKCRRNKEDKNILEVQCHLCKKWFVPGYRDVRNKMRAINEIDGGEANLYCSEECKENCPTYRRISRFSWQVPVNKHSEYYDNSQLETWADQIKINAGYKCERCGSQNKLNSHHINPKSLFPEQALDIDNGVCLCHNCHIKAHKINGCGFNELRQCEI